MVDISHPDFEDHIESVNQILQDIKSADKPTIMVFNKIDVFKSLFFDENDLAVEKTTKHYTLDDWKQTWMSKLGESKTLFISATEKANFEEFREKVYEAVREIHITVSHTTNSYTPITKKQLITNKTSTCLKRLLYLQLVIIVFIKTCVLKIVSSNL